MLTEIFGIVMSGVEVILVWNSPFAEDFVERRSACVEPIIVLVSTIKVYFQTFQFRGSRESERAIAFPERRVRRTAEHPAQDAGARRIGSGPEENR